MNQVTEFASKDNYYCGDVMAQNGMAQSRICYMAIIIINECSDVARLNKHHSECIAWRKYQGLILFIPILRRASPCQCRAREGLRIGDPRTPTNQPTLFNPAV